MRLIRRVDRERLGISLKNIEAPFFAKFYVERALHTPGERLCRFDIDSFGSPMSIQKSWIRLKTVISCWLRMILLAR